MKNYWQFVLKPRVCYCSPGRQLWKLAWQAFSSERPLLLHTGRKPTWLFCRNRPAERLPSPLINARPGCACVCVSRIWLSLSFNHYCAIYPNPNYTHLSSSVVVPRVSLTKIMMEPKPHLTPTCHFPVSFFPTCRQFTHKICALGCAFKWL